MPEDEELKQPNFSQIVAVDAYREAFRQALTAADGGADSILTAAFGIATAYGALIGLVSARDTPQPIVAGLPFVFLAVAVFLAMAARLTYIATTPSNTVDTIDAAVNQVVKRKHRLAWAALGALVIGVLVAAYVVVHYYRK